MKKLRIGIIGCGHWGPNQINSFYFNSEATVSRVCDINLEHLKNIKSLYKDIEISQKPEDITQASDIDAVVICTPTSTHYSLTKDALLNGKDVLCEKPLCIKIEEGEELTKIANERKLILMVGHVFLFNTGILRLKDYIKSNELGQIYYYYSQRTNLGPIRNDVNVVYDLASHDIYIFNFLLEGIPKVISATGKCILQPGIEDIAFISLEYPGDILVHLHVSWLDPKKVREITVIGSKKMVTWNDMMFGRPLEIFSKHVQKESYPNDLGHFNLVAKEGEILIPHVKNEQPLKLQTEHFIKCVKERKKPLSSGESSLKVVETLGEIEKILAKSRVTKRNPELSLK